MNADGLGLLGRFQNFTQAVSEPLFTVGSSDVTPLRAALVLALLVVLLWITKRLEARLQRLADRRPGLNRSTFLVLSRLVRYSLWVVGGLLALHAAGIDLSAIALLTGAIGIGIGLGMQGLFNNIVSGFFLLGEKSLRVGDIVSLESGVAGTVRNIGLRHTLVTTGDGGSVMVPNSELVLKPVTHWTLDHASRRLHIPFKVGRGVTQAQVAEVVIEATNELPETLCGPKYTAELWLIELGDYGMAFELVVWVNRVGVDKPLRTRARYLAAVAEALARHDIPLAAAVRQVEVTQAEPQRLA
jgi:small-conductance mechanosensitive channel